jgi:peptidylprolyl isomerase
MLAVKRLSILIIAVCAALVIAGCGSSDDSSSTGSNDAAATNAGSTSTESTNAESTQTESTAPESKQGESTDSGSAPLDAASALAAKVKRGEASYAVTQQQADAEELSGIRLKAKPVVPKPQGPPPKELTTKDWVPGAGPVAEEGDEVVVQYTGVDYKTGKEFDSTSFKDPFIFTLGAGEVIPGWEQGLIGMKVNGRREVVIPPDLAYGSTGQPPKIPPNETLVFMVDLLGSY